MTYETQAAENCHIINVGNENTTVITIDDLAEDLVTLRQRACAITDYGPDGQTGYPGIRAVLHDNYTANIMSAICPLLFKTYGIPDTLSPTVELAYYSLLTKTDQELRPLQRVPHFDTTKMHYYAVLHYLNEGNFGGTGFFRHRPTGFERITEARKELYIQSASAFMATKGLPEEKYISSSTNHYELIAGVSYQANRLVIYPGNILHSGLVSSAVDVCNKPEYGRLTANIFINFS